MLPGVAAARHDAPLTAAPMPYHWPMLGIDVQGSAGASGGPFCGALQLVANATSLGGPETLVEHRASEEGANAVSPPGLLRMSVGLEHADDLIADLAQALASA